MTWIAMLARADTGVAAGAVDRRLGDGHGRPRVGADRRGGRASSAC
jgi:hypothetical protein